MSALIIDMLRKLWVYSRSNCCEGRSLHVNSGAAWDKEWEKYTATQAICLLWTLGVLLGWTPSLALFQMGHLKASLGILKSCFLTA